MNYKTTLYLLFSFLVSLPALSQTEVAYTAPGVYAWVVPSCVTQVIVQVYGAGGGGGGSNTNSIGGGGGGGGGYATASINVVPGSSITINVGAGGIGGGPAGSGTTGAQSNFNVSLQAFGGQGGMPENLGGTGGNGGIGSVWATNITGNVGATQIAPNGGAGGNNNGPLGGIGGIGGTPGVNGSVGNTYGAGGGGGGKKFGVNTFGGNGGNGAVIISYGRVYRTISGGNWNNPAIWDPTFGQPPQNLPCSDSMIISNGDIVVLTNDLNIYGALIVEAGGQLGTGENFEIAISADQAPAVYPLPFPLGVHGRIYNDGLINTIGKFHNDGFSYNSGVIFCNDYHNDFYQCNSGDITAYTQFENHGGKIECCGNIYTEKLKLKKQTSDKGYVFYFSDGGWGVAGQATNAAWGESVVLCQNICNLANDADPPAIQAPAGGMSGGDVLQNNDVEESYTASNASDPNLVTFCGWGFLPVQLISFSAIALEERNVGLFWKTATEINNDYFSIERSYDGTDWELVGIVDGAEGGTSSTLINYSLEDHFPFSGTSYYRLKQTDFDGKFTYSDVRSVDLSKSNEAGISVFPNPGTHEIFIEGDESELEMIRIYNVQGQDISNSVEVVSLSPTTKHLDISNLSSGMYTIRTLTYTTKYIKK
ncbi:MAG: T9SS type A sorting domain-containing protein [Crocinitomicaceae bacterium]|nr:T9SS type A sorting domain-containing protein [Crocinitomicaceae bacterium]